MRFRCPTCQRQFRLAQDRIAPTASARLTCPGCQTSLLLARSEDPEVLNVSVVAALAPTAADFFGDPGAQTPLPPLALPRQAAKPAQPRDASSPPDYTKLLQEFSVLFRLHSKKKRAGLRTAIGLSLGALLAVAGVALFLSSPSTWDALVQKASPVAIAVPLQEPVAASEPSEPVERAPMLWPGLDAVAQAWDSARPATPQVVAQVPGIQPILAAKPPILPAPAAREPPQSARPQAQVAALAGVALAPATKTAAVVMVPTAVRPALRVRPIAPPVHALAPRGLASAALRPAKVAPRPTAALDPSPSVRPLALDELLDDDLAPHRGAGPSTPPPPEL